MLPELTPRWNLVLLDDGSSDATPEILEELARPYPQVSVIHNSVSEGDGACFRRGAEQQGRFAAVACERLRSGSHGPRQDVETGDFASLGRGALARRRRA